MILELENLDHEKEGEVNTLPRIHSDKTWQWIADRR